MRIKFFFWLSLILSLCSCNQPLPSGVVASVNGEPITLRSVQALLDSRSAALGIPSRPSVAEMQQDCRDAASILIVHTLVRQVLAARGLEVDEKQVDEAIKQVRGDFGDENLEDYLADASLREDEWRMLMRDHLALQIFAERILLPAIKVSLEEIRAYYKEHEAEFALPESALVCYATGEQRDTVAAWCETLEKSGSESGAFTQCVEIVAKDAPSPWDIKKMKPGECGPILEQDGQWRSLALLEKREAKKPLLSEVYGLIENILIEQKKIAAFEQWLEQAIAGATIMGVPELFPRQKTGPSS